MFECSILMQKLKHMLTDSIMEGINSTKLN